jgi:peroxiredoxin
MKDRTDLLAILFGLLFAVCPIQTKAAAVELPTGPRQDYPASKRLFNPVTGHDYQLIDVSMSWHDAKEYCESIGGHLATVSTAAENAFIYGNFGRDHVCWLGATDETNEGKWQWVTGEPFEFQNWAPGEPNDPAIKEPEKDYLVLGTTSGVNEWGVSYQYRSGSRWKDHSAPGWFGGAAIAYPVCEWEEHDEKAVADSVDSTSRYALPTGGPVELLAFIEKLREQRPLSELEAAEHRRRAQHVMLLAARRILSLETDEWSKPFQTALRILLEDRAHVLTRATSRQQRETLGHVKTYLTAKAEKGLQSQDVDLALTVATALESGGSFELARQAYNDFATLVAQSKEKDISDMAKVFEGAIRRFELTGKQLQLDGTKMDGSKFDWSAYRGKVVLVYFWSTASTACQVELPSFELNYQLYHDRGFEVVGIGTDGDREGLEEFVKQQQLSWAILHEEDLSTPHPWTTHYGITILPTALLVDKDGVVVSVRACRAELDELLEKLIGPPYVPKGKLTYVDLQPKANQKLTESLERMVRPNNLAELPQGEQTFGGVGFRVGESLIHLGHNRRPAFPRKVEGIPVDRQFARLYIFHGVQWAPRDGTKIADYIVHYEDGTRQTIPVVKGEDVRDWWNGDDSKPVTRGKVVWAGQNAVVRGENKHLRLYLATWNNPHPGKTVICIDFVSPENSESGPFCVAMTVEGAVDCETEQ